MSQLQRQLDDTRAQLSRLAHAQQLAESNARTTAVQLAADIQIRELRIELELANVARRTPPPTPPAADSPTDVLALNLAMHNLNAWVANPDLVKTVALGVIVTVKEVSDLCATLFKLLGNLRGAQVYENYLSYILQLPRPGAEDTDETFANSAVCANLDAAFGVYDRPPSPEEPADNLSVASTSASHGSIERVKENALKVDAVLSGDVPSPSDPPSKAVDQCRTVDGLLLQAARHAVKAGPGSAVFDAAQDARTFLGAVLALLHCAGHNDDQTRDRHKRVALGPCSRYAVLAAAQGGTGAVTFQQIAQIALYDYKRRLVHMHKISLSYLAAELALANMPSATGGSRKDFKTEMTQSIMKLAASDALDPDSFATTADAVLADYRHVAPTGTYLATDPHALSEVLCVTRSPAVAAAAIPARPASAKHAKGKGSPALPVPPPTIPPAAVRPPTGPPSLRRVCGLGAGCQRTIVEWDPARPGFTRIIEHCPDFHEQVQYRLILRDARFRLAPMSPAPPAAAPTPATSAAAPGSITPAAHSADIQAYIRQHQPAGGNRPACVMVPACTAVVTTTLQAALDGYNSALAQCAADERSIPSSVPSARLTQFCADHGGKSPRQYHDGLLSLWEAYLAALAADLPPATGAAFLATSANIKKVLILDSGSGPNLGPHLTPTDAPDALSSASGATSPLRTAPHAQRVQTAGGSAVSLDEVFDCRMWVRAEDDTLILVKMETNNVPGLYTQHRALFVMSTAVLVDGNDGEMVSRPLARGGSYCKFQLKDPDFPDGRTFLSDKVALDFSELGAAQIQLAEPRPDEPYFVAVLRPLATPGDGPAALAVRAALRVANQPPPTPPPPHPAMVAVRIRSSDSLPPFPPAPPLSHGDGSREEDAAAAPDVRVPEPAPTLRVQQFVAGQHLLYRAQEIVEIVDIYPAHDPLDEELPGDQFYSVPPAYFDWDDSGVFRRMIQRSSRRWVNQLPTRTYEWLACTPAQLLAELEQQLSLLVQGLAKARSDAVDGDGAIPAAGTATTTPTHPAVLALDQFPPNSPITPLSHDDDSCEEDDTVASAVHIPEPAPVAVTSLLSAPAVTPADTTSSTPDPTGCKAQPILPKDRRGPDDDDGGPTDDSDSVSRKRTKSASTSSVASADTPAAAADTPMPGSGTETVRAAGLPDLTDFERLTISHHAWCADLNTVPAKVPPGVALPAVRLPADANGTSMPSASPGRYGPLADAAGTVPPTPARNRSGTSHATSAAAIFVLCMCVHQLPGRPCLGRPAPGSVTCTDCLPCSDGRPCTNSARPPFCSTIVPPARYQWPADTPKAVFLDPAAGTLSYTIARLTDAPPTAIALAWDVLPPEVALADMVRAYPHLLPRTIYVQVVPGTLVTPELITGMLSDLCDAAVADVVEMMCGPCCNTTTCRSGKKKNPHRRHIDGVLRPVTYEAAVADVFYSNLFDTIRFIRSANPQCSFILENPADGLLRELPQMQALLADIPATFIVHDHCTLACEPIDHWHGSTQKPTQYVVIGYDPHTLPGSLRCAKLGCPHRLSLDADAYHCLVQQLPAKRHRQDGQMRVCAESAARIPVGVFRHAFPLSARLHPTPTSGSISCLAAVSPPTPLDLPPYGAYLSLRIPADHRLRRLTPLTCVFDATTLHAICGHTLRGQRLADSANQWQGFRMLNASGQLLSAPNITAADVRLDAHCDVCTRTQMQAAPSHHAHPRAGRQLPASVACPAPFGLADVSASFLGANVPWYSEAVPIPTWGNWLLPTASCPMPPPPAMPALTPIVSTTPPPEEGETHLSDSSDYDTPAPGRCPDSSDSDAEAERDVDTIPTTPPISDRVFTQPHARGPECRTFADLELLPDHMRKGRLAHWDIIHSELASPGRPLKAGVTAFLVCVDVGILHVAFRPLRSTKDITRAYKEIVIEQGWTSQPHACHCVTDGEPGLMAPVRAAAAAMGQSWDTLPPYAANANHAGSHIIKHLRAAVRGYILGASEHPLSVINGSYEAYAWAQAVLIHNISSIAGHPLCYSPYRLAHGISPVFTSVPFGAKVYIHIPKDCRAGARNRGDNSAANRSEPGVAIGPRSQRDSLPLVLTSRNTTKASRTTYLAPDDSPHGVIGVVLPPVPVSTATHVDAAIAAVNERVLHNQRVKAIQRATNEMFTAHDDSIVLSPGPLVDRAKHYISCRCKAVAGLSVSAALSSKFLTANGTLVTYRRADLQWDLDHNYVTAALAVPPDGTSEDYDSECAQAAHLACLALPDPGLDPITYVCPLPEQRARIDALVAIVAMSDLPWKAFLNGPERAHVTAAWYRELNALLDLKALVPLIPGSPDWQEAVKSKTTTPCRVLLDFKRDGTWKCRVVTRGDLEDKVALDGPDFHYYSNVSRMSTVRCAALRAGRDTLRPGRTGGRVISTCDIANAFLQTTPFPENERRFLMIRSPIDGTVTYYRQLISVYGSCSASARWETTFSSWPCSPEAEGGPGFGKHIYRSGFP